MRSQALPSSIFSFLADDFAIISKGSLISYICTRDTTQVKIWCASSNLQLEKIIYHILGPMYQMLQFAIGVQNNNLQTKTKYQYRRNKWVVPRFFLIFLWNSMMIIYEITYILMMDYHCIALIKAGTRSQIVSKIDQLVLMLTTYQIDGKLPFHGKLRRKKEKKVNFEKIVTCSYPFILTMLSYKNMIYKIELLEIVYLSLIINIHILYFLT